MSGWTNKIPSFLWIPIFVGGVALFIGGALALFYGFGYVEGFGSLVILVLGWLGFRAGNNSDEKDVGGSFGVALGITFFALMGMALDQTGNFIYNQPITWIFCPDGSEIMRETIQKGARGGGISLSQSFTCVAQSGEIVRRLGMFEHLAYRFAQYVALGYVMLYASRIYGKIKNSGTTNNDGV
jgi:hypothetical protein